MIVIPAIDVIEGKCVRLSKGDYDTKKVYSDDPVAMARRFEDAGLTHLHLVDLEGARAHEPRNLDVLSAICEATDLVVDYGGGMYATSSLEEAFSRGASYVTCGSIAVRDPDLAALWIDRWKERIILGADCIDGLVSSGAWMDRSSLDVVEFILKYMALGVGMCISTDISRDGMLSGPGYELYGRILSSCPAIRLVASGGIGSTDDLERLAGMGLYGAIVGKAFYEGRITPEEMKEVEQCLPRG